MKFTLKATIPVQAYGNLSPEIEVEADTFDAAFAQAMPYIHQIWDAYGEKPLAGGDRQKLEAFVGGEIFYDPVAHVYTNQSGDVYLSGSQYAQTFEKPFDAPRIAQTMATKYKVKASDILAMWKLKADVSKGFGTAIHAALELYGRYNSLAEALDKTTHLHDHPVIKKAVESFYDGRKGEIAECEALIVSHDLKHAGRVDRLLITGTHSCRIQDFKTNAVIDSHLKPYWEQLKFYGQIMEANGWAVEGFDIFHWDGEWHNYSKENDEEDHDDSTER